MFTSITLCFSLNYLFTGRAIDLASVDNASRREPPIVTASRTGQLEIAALLAAYGADLEVRDGQVTIDSLRSTSNVMRYSKMCKT